MHKNEKIDRLHYEPTFGYRPGVLIGPHWFEENLQYVKNKYKFSTTYRDDYLDPGPTTTDPKERWNNKIPGDGFDPRVTLDHEHDKYHENYSTVTDLCYNYLAKKPKKLRLFNKIRRVWLPEQDFALNYGNVTQFGLKEKLRDKWAFENATGPKFWTTENRENFYAYKDDAYKIKTYGNRKDISTNLYKINHDNIDLRLRGNPMVVLPELPICVKKRPYPHFYF